MQVERARGLTAFEVAVYTLSYQFRLLSRLQWEPKWTYLYYSRSHTDVHPGAASEQSHQRVTTVKVVRDEEDGRNRSCPKWEV